MLNGFNRGGSIYGILRRTGKRLCKHWAREKMETRTGHRETNGETMKNWPYELWERFEETGDWTIWQTSEMSSSLGTSPRSIDKGMHELGIPVRTLNFVLKTFSGNSTHIEKHISKFVSLANAFRWDSQLWTRNYLWFLKGPAGHIYEMFPDQERGNFDAVTRDFLRIIQFDQVAYSIKFRSAVRNKAESFQHNFLRLTE